MTKKEKRIKRLSKMRGELELTEVKVVLEKLGYSLKRVKGSHHIFKDSHGKIISLPVHNKKIRQNYLKYIIQPHERSQKSKI